MKFLLLLFLFVFACDSPTNISVPIVKNPNVEPSMLFITSPDKKSNLDTNLLIQWTCFDENRDTLHYDVCLMSSIVTGYVKVKTNIVENQCLLQLEACSAYFIKVFAYDKEDTISKEIICYTIRRGDSRLYGTWEGSFKNYYYYKETFNFSKNTFSINTTKSACPTCSSDYDITRTGSWFTYKDSIFTTDSTAKVTYYKYTQFGKKIDTVQQIKLVHDTMVFLFEKEKIGIWKKDQSLWNYYIKK